MMNLNLSENTCYCYTGARRLEPGRPTVVFIHGAGHDHSVWTLQTRYFASHGWNVVAPDLPCHGRSGGPALASIEALADWVLALLGALGIEQAMLVGHSMGSLIALEAAARAPGRVTRLALVGSVFPMPVAPPLLEATLSARERAHGMINQWSYAPHSQLGASSVPGVNLTALNQRLMERQAPGVLATDLGACDAYADGLSAAVRVTAATALICGARDQMTPPRAARPLQQALVNASGGARMITLDTPGHAIMAEAPEALARAVEAFLAPD